MNRRKAILERVLNATDKDQLAEAYSEWADRYDQDALDELGYVAPTLVSELLHEHLPRHDAVILDAGCGTGIVGERLHALGYRHLVGLDYSREMLEKARAKAIYEALHQADLTARLEFADDRFDAVTCVGTFTCGHVGPEAFDELIRVTRPGGAICFTVRDMAWEDDAFRDRIEALRERGLWEPVEVRRAAYLEEEDSSCMLCLYRLAA